jgi:hypothetical protein
MTKLWSQTGSHLIVATFLFLISQTSEAVTADLKVILGKGMPLWPIFKQTAKPIDEALIANWRKWARKCEADKNGGYKAFPSKYKDELTTGDEEKCDDGDMTSFNGYLCAVGITEGCDAVRDAMAPDGHWFRSPRRRAFAIKECPKGQAVVDAVPGGDYCERCVSTFSPDMGLGVILFAVAEKDRDSFAKWLRWIDSERLSTPLCEVAGAPCQRLPWIRYCTDDIPCKRKKELSDKGIPDRTGGEYFFKTKDKRLYLGGCTARPFDAYDFSVSSRALNLTAAAKHSYD